MKVTLNLSLMQLNDLENVTEREMIRAKQVMEQHPGNLVYEMWYERSVDTYQQIADTLGREYMVMEEMMKIKL
jgi:hypothetical protein